MGRIERRAHPRIDTKYVTVEIYISTLQSMPTQVEEICSVLDLSESGMRFGAEKKFITGQILRLTFLLPDSIVIIRTDAIVVHTEKNHNSTKIGVQFKNLGLAEKKLIRHFVEKSFHNKSQPQ